jgi:hypothetical protein
MATVSFAQLGRWDGASYTSADTKLQRQVSSLPFTTRERSLMSLAKTLAKASEWQLLSSNTLTHGGYPSNSSTHIRYAAAAPTLWLCRVFSDTQIQKMGRWRGATFKEYIREQLARYSEGMTAKMKRNFKFVNVHGNAYYDVTSTCVLSEYASAA